MERAWSGPLKPGTPVSRTGLTGGVKVKCMSLVINEKGVTSPHGAILAGAAEGGPPARKARLNPFCDLPAPLLPLLCPES